ncbi:PREDICTED: 28 kDa ribonucleoprotein, chloroplastic-like isoform X1 [Lupinus angustifolius]|uniref:28 kDa ribonucleoprotein, chloroplastic-like isoform X1 n=1 Tax=Lupinus angustifolius TaxID=3871 RepID=UPI00092E3234|nr:PREDICTED: 28 kDa ribonucleoprotein, chloroplastic-like isoform X1 [Lupinus angustifolius]XP_019415661.1 PREDICTED: 28 kDa ribonucleoprotein, chloroplastic-like isoform X1 [Lupinus angustifolius]XP_019415662.1 PREDICTED: 28 kDa ribonucleoprotein, chloroplastic-like isoform X1 [Lupinus angustifolius]XP_019415663.1 PREDICTED: 28 kDa ribonucleoprotein, chloroplastic-like isoform X1 [Lupinus angustifolius]XP_019415664.1 PREDICTED: 28 kDa ribonucleoprotein, chloroplastic-like isoform X1 [Lupinus 
MVMALRLQHHPWNPSLTHFSTQHQSHNQNSFLSLQKHSLTNFSLRLSLFTTKQTRPHFTLRFATTSQKEEETQQTETEEPTEEFSQTRLLAQNVPWTSTPEDIRSLFEKHGKVLQVELSMHNKTRNRGLAFVEMGSPEEAVEAMKNLELSEFEGRIIKLNYAKPKKKKTPPPTGAPKPEVLFNVFVANLSYEARSKDLKEFFETGSGSESIVSAEVIFHDTPRKSSGYGFVSFKSKKQADEALTEFDGKIFMGRPIRVERSNRFVKLAAEESAKSEDASSELSVNEAEANIADNDASSVLSVNEAEANIADKDASSELSVNEAEPDKAD